MREQKLWDNHRFPVLEGVELVQPEPHFYRQTDAILPMMTGEDSILAWSDGEPERYLMGRRKNDFNEKDKIRVLLWCARHCCLCGQACGLNIEVAHLDEKKNDIDNAIPLCFQCHADVGRYNRRHPRGRKYSIEELRRRRDQVYEEQTSRLVPQVRYQIFQGEFRQKLPEAGLPDVGFTIQHLGGPFPVRARVKVTLFRGDKEYDPATKGHYDGRYIWNFSPGFSVTGHFKLPREILSETADLSIRAMVEVTLIDIYEREHNLLPEGFILDLEREPKLREWYLEPCMEEVEPKKVPDQGRRGDSGQHRTASQSA